MSKADEDSQSRSGRNWLSTLHESRVNCREKVADAMVEVPNPEKVLWPVKPRNRMSGPHQAAMEAHVSVIDYADQVIPYRDERGLDEEMWTKTLATVNLSDSTQAEISLGSLDSWEAEFYVEQIEQKDELYGEQKQSKQYRVLLPVTGMRSCYRQLNEITKALGFAAEADVAGLPTGGLKTPEPRQ